jgi:hypothetical protein
MSDDKRIDLRPYGIARKVDVRVIRAIRVEHTQNGELSHLVVCLKNGEELLGTAVVGSGAVHQQEKLFLMYQQKLGGG